MTIQLELLEKIPYFEGLMGDQLEAIRRVVLEKNIERGTLLLLEGEPAQALCFLVSGALKEFKTSMDGKEQILKIVRPGESFNDVPIFDGGNNVASVLAMSQALIYEITKTDLEHVLRKYPQVAMNVIKVLGGQVRQLVSLVEDLSFRHVIGRVAKILLENAGDGAGPGPKLTQQEIAAMAGTAREVVGRSLKSLEEQGAIKLVRHRITVVDKGELEAMAGTPV